VPAASKGVRVQFWENLVKALYLSNPLQRARFTAEIFLPKLAGFPFEVGILEV
jgi:hypothetical protein